MRRVLPPSHRAAFRAAFLIAALFSLSVHTRAQMPPSPNNLPPASAPVPAAGQIDVPVQEVVLFSSGVGYFQHQGTVQGDASAELRFKTNQINDILKSLVLQDLDGGRVGAVTYPSQDPLEKTLSSFQVDISDNPSLGDLLNKLRGARVSLAYVGAAGVENFPATILGVEKRQVPGGGSSTLPLEKEFVNVVGDKGIRSLEMDKVTKIQLDDPGLQEELNKALAALAGARDQDKKPVTIRFGGQGERRVRLGYVVETPIWKASYRLILGEAPDAKSGKPTATLQGWAIVENQTDNDWNNVKLSLVSGRPISFIQDLYQPLYVPRPTVKPELYSSLRPQEYDAGQAAPGIFSVAGVVTDPKFQVNARALNQPARALAQPAPASPRAMMRKGLADTGANSESANAIDALLFGGEATTQNALQNRQTNGSSLDTSAFSDSFDPSQSISSITDAAKVGELFQYTVGSVSLPRQRSAMIPIINDPIDAEKLSIFNQGTLDKHPLNGVRLKNNSADKKNFLAGPVTVFDEGRYAGDARLDNVTPGQERLLSYGIDLQVLVNVKDLADKQAIQSGKIVKGVLQVSRKYVSAKEYSAESKADRDKKLIVEHPLRQGWNLVDSPKPAETTEKLYRFEQTLGAGKTEKLVVKEENVQDQRLALLPMNLGELLNYSRTGEISQPVRDALAKAVSLKQAADETQRQINERDGQVNQITQEQDRIRENLKALQERTSDYSTRLLKKLDDQESQIEKLRTEADKLREKLDTQRNELASYLNGLNVG